MDLVEPAILNRPASFNVPLAPPPAHPLYPMDAKARPSTSAAVQVDIKQLEDALKRSVTIVFWHKPNCPPIRLHEEVTTFPLFQLSQISQLVAACSLSPATYVDVYNPFAATWEQQTISAVRVVESEQRLLFRVRKNLLEGLNDADCPGLSQEVSLQSRLHLQPSLAKNPNKRSASELDDSPGEQRRPPSHRPGVRLKDYSPKLSSARRVASDVVPQDSPIAGPSSFVHPSPPLDKAEVYSPNGPQIHGDSFSSDGEGPTPPTTGQLAKRWPNDYTVSELSSGFQQMDLLCAQQASLTQRMAFERVFACRYVKSTVCRHRGVWKRARKELRETFERMGSDPRAIWSEFLKHVEGGTGRTDGGPRKRPPKPPPPPVGEMTVVMAPEMLQLGLSNDSALSSPKPRSAMDSMRAPSSGWDDRAPRRLYDERSSSRTSYSAHVHGVSASHEPRSLGYLSTAVSSQEPRA